MPCKIAVSVRKLSLLKNMTGYREDLIKLKDDGAGSLAACHKIIFLQQETGMPVMLSNVSLCCIKRKRKITCYVVVENFRQL